MTPSVKDEDGLIDPERVDWEHLSDSVDVRIRALAAAWIKCRRLLPPEDMRRNERDFLLPILSLLLHFIDRVEFEPASDARSTQPH